IFPNLFSRSTDLLQSIRINNQSLIIDTFPDSHLQEIQNKVVIHNGLGTRNSSYFFKEKKSSQGFSRNLDLKVASMIFLFLMVYITIFFGIDTLKIHIDPLPDYANEIVCEGWIDISGLAKYRNAIDAQNQFNLSLPLYALFQSKLGFNENRPRYSNYSIIVTFEEFNINELEDAILHIFCSSQSKLALNSFLFLNEKSVLF
ncbi:hypothetical protein HMI56_004115, partial [Coelomomyces lativittatus]